MAKRSAEAAELEEIDRLATPQAPLPPQGSAHSTPSSTSTAAGATTAATTTTSSSSSAPRERERMRVSKACDICKRKKTKCDGMNPCSACEKNRRVCLYSASSAGSLAPITGSDNASDNGSSSRGGALPSARGGGQGNDQVIQRLLGRINQLERMTGISALSNSTATPQSMANGTMGAPSLETDGYHSLNDLERFNADPLALSEMVEPEHVSSSYPKLRFSNKFYTVLGNVFGRNIRQMLTPAHQKMVSIPRIQFYGYNLSGRHYLNHRIIAPPKRVLARELEEYLLNYFFDHVNPLFAILHKPVFMKQYETAMDQQEKPECRLFIAMFHAVCAIAMRWSEIHENKQYPDRLEEELFDDAYYAIQAFAFECESIEVVQGLLLLTIYVRAVGRQPTCWAILGQALRLAYGLGLMKKTHYHHKRGYDTHKCERVFWCCYTLDRLVGIDFGRSFMFRDDEVTWEAPSAYIDDGWLTPTAYGLLKLAICVSPFNTHVSGHQPQSLLVSIYQDLLEWNHTMEIDFGLGSDARLSPKTHKWKNVTNDIAMICHFRLEYHQAVFYTFRLSLLALAVSPRWDVSVTSADRRAVLHSAKGVVDAVSEMLLQHNGRVRSVWWHPLSQVHNACSIMLLLVNSGIGNHSEIAPYILKAMECTDRFASDSRFGMGRECQWSLRTMNHLVCMRLQEGQMELQKAGIDHGGPEINKLHFSAYGPLDGSGNTIPLQQSPGHTPGSTSSYNQHPQQPHTMRTPQPPPVGTMPSPSDLQNYRTSVMTAQSPGQVHPHGMHSPLPPPLPLPPPPPPPPRHQTQSQAPQPDFSWDAESLGSSLEWFDQFNFDMPTAASPFPPPQSAPQFN